METLSADVGMLRSPIGEMLSLILGDSVSTSSTILRRIPPTYVWVIRVHELSPIYNMPWGSAKLPQPRAHTRMRARNTNISDENPGFLRGGGKGGLTFLPPFFWEKNLTGCWIFFFCLQEFDVGPRILYGSRGRTKSGPKYCTFGLVSHNLHY